MATNSQKRKSELYIKEREEGFNLRFGCSFSNQPYNALRDAHMKHFFESEQRIQHLQKQGQIDQFGRVIDMDTHRLVVVENEIKRAEALEKLDEKEAEDARCIIRRERIREKDQMRKLKNVERRKSEMQIHMELTKAERELLGQSHLYKGVTK